MRKAFTLLCLLAGLALFAWLLWLSDLDALVYEVIKVGAAGFGVVLAIYALEFLCDTLSWQLTIAGLPVTPRWTARLYLVRLTGEAYNVVTPLGGMGGEPVKALILNRHHALPYAQSVASLVLAKTANVSALLVFLAVGFALMLGDARIGTQPRALAGAGFAALALGVAGFFLVQRLGISSRVAARLGTTRPRLARVLVGMQEFDRLLLDFYTSAPLRLALVLALAIVNWLLGAAAVWATLHFMGRPASFADAWVIEAMTQLVRAGTFFIPASLGAQDGAIMLVMRVMTGDALAGLALALVRRARELIWVLAGLLVSVPLLGRARATPRR